MKEPHVTILMATYNGEKFIKEQINSIVSQTYENWELIIRDDGSSDDTVKIIEQYVEDNKQICYITTPSLKKGACSNFAELYSWVKENRSVEYLMFCDQDDIWKENKISKAYEALKKVEIESNYAPTLVYGDLELIDDSGQSLHHSLKLRENLNIKTLIAQNSAFGCTMMINKELVNKIHFIHESAENHDYWIALIACAFGHTSYIKEKLIFYRQHEHNVTNQKKHTLKEKIYNYFSKNTQQTTTLYIRNRMLYSFYNIYKEELNKKDFFLLSRYINQFNLNRFSLVCFIILNGIRRYNLSQNVAYLYVNLIYYKSISIHIKK